jgi:hypothetical protein
VRRWKRTQCGGLRQVRLSPNYGPQTSRRASLWTDHRSPDRSVVPIADVARSIAGAMSMAAGMTARMR